MANDEFAKLEAALNAVAKMTSERETTLDDARCPNCGGAEFAKIGDLYFESSVRMYSEPERVNERRASGLSDAEVVDRFAPPKQTSIMGITAITGVVLSVIVYFVYRRFGDDAATFSGMGAAALLMAVALTNARRFSDRYYDRKGKWNRTYRCMKCGQLIRV